MSRNRVHSIIVLSIYLKLGTTHGMCFIQKIHIDCLVQYCSNSIANALELLQSCTEPSISRSLFNHIQLMIISTDTHVLYEYSWDIFPLHNRDEPENVCLSRINGWWSVTNSSKVYLIDPRHRIWSVHRIIPYTTTRGQGEVAIFEVLMPHDITHDMVQVKFAFFSRLRPLP